ncbi:aspartyl/glutamyl-tRNA(Asn/Gln) amidotransferase, A subunit [Sphaceloma murrayae]|uniref:Aspartyl/glutamyl-tRNA(Asn/Gln) amidotransferase, A subunit n=1 Tax=Sphaceloma murrayae TaxID=2082308 RepID=A0A2K1QHN1_9PEZI|nr:aspartyl/glutamyl-tRNA(Asn/Gln) amidotransferase, A subunit [Sphaceloma murrayae]
MSEWASMRSTVYSTGFNPRVGQCRNPYNLEKTPFGSSSGSAVAVASNFVPLSLGTETDTSIIGPASIDGVVGIKPTVELTSRKGVIPMSHNLDSVGTFGRTVADAVGALDGILDPKSSYPPDFVRSGEQIHPLSSYLSNSSVLRGARFGLPMRRCWELCPLDCKTVAARLIDALETAGATIVQVDLPSIEERTSVDGKWNWRHGTYRTSEWTVVKSDAYNGINEYLGTLTGSNIHSIEDIAGYDKVHDSIEGASPGMVPAFPSGHDALLQIIDSKGLQSEAYQQVLKHIRRQT